MAVLEATDPPRRLCILLFAFLALLSLLDSLQMSYIPYGLIMTNILFDIRIEIHAAPVFQIDLHLLLRSKRLVAQSIRKGLCDPMKKANPASSDFKSASPCLDFVQKGLRCRFTKQTCTQAFSVSIESN